MTVWSQENVVRPPKAWGRVTFAEDARFELSGSFSLIGVIPSDVVFPVLPGVIPKIAIFTEIVMPVDQANEPVTMRIYLPGSSADEPFYEEVLDGPSEERPATLLESGLAPPVFSTGKIRRIAHVGVHVGLQIDHPGWIEVRALVGQKIIPIGALAVRVQSPSDQG